MKMTAAFGRKQGYERSEVAKEAVAEGLNSPCVVRSGGTAGFHVRIIDVDIEGPFISPGFDLYRGPEGTNNFGFVIAVGSQ
jgi:hypothetical protein